MNKGRRNDPSSSEVDDLLRAAEEHLLLELRLNSHSKSSDPFTSPSLPLDSDLARRFDALKSSPRPNPNPSPKPIKSLAADEESSRALGDDLAARFAALKSSGSISSGLPTLALPPGVGLDCESSDGGGGDDDEVSKKEVEKLIEWTKDAARLDPVKNDDDGDDDNGGNVHDDDEDSEDSDDSVEERRKKKEKSKGKPKSKRFIFF